MMRPLFVAILFSVLTPSAVFAADVVKVKGTSALIDLKGESVEPGTMFYALSADGKRRGIIEVAKIKGDKAIGKVTKGKVEAGMHLEAKGAGKSGGAQHTAKGSGASPSGRAYWGAMLGFAMDSMKANVNVAGTNTLRSTESLTGNAFSAMAMFDYEVFPQIWFRGLGGMEGFNVAGSSVCGVANREACNANIYYISLDGLARYVFSTGSIRPWLGAGLALMFPASKTSTALDSGSIATTSVIQIAGGVDWFISPTMYVPLSVEYGMLPKSNEVEASWIEVRAGLAFPF